MLKNQTIPNSVVRTLTSEEKANIIADRLCPNKHAPLTRILLREVIYDILTDAENAKVSDIIHKLSDILNREDTTASNISIICSLMYDLLPFWDASLDCMLKWSTEAPNNSQRLEMSRSAYQTIEMSGSEEEQKFFELYKRANDDFAKYGARALYIYSVIRRLDLTLKKDGKTYNMPQSAYIKWIANGVAGSVREIKGYDVGEKGVANVEFENSIYADDTPNLLSSKIVWLKYYISLIAGYYIKINNDIVPAVIDYMQDIETKNIFWDKIMTEKERSKNRDFQQWRDDIIKGNEYFF